MGQSDLSQQIDTNTPYRIIALAHRVKARIVDGEVKEALPTRVMICDVGGQVISMHDLEDEGDELLFVRGAYPVKWQDIDPENYTPPSRESDVKWGKVKKGENIPASLIKEIDGEQMTPRKIAIAWDGLRSGDTVLMTLGGSGDPLGYAISRQGESDNFKLYRMPPWRLKQLRGEKPSDQKIRDTSELTTLISAWVNGNQNYFYHCDAADRERISIAAHYSNFKQFQKYRMAAAAQMRQSLIGRVFMALDGLFPEGAIHALLTRFASAVKELFPKGRKKSGPAEVLEQLQLAEADAKHNLEKAVTSSRVWKLFESIEGVGPSIGGALIAAIGDIRKFSGPEKLWAFCGLHTLKPDGTKFEKGEDPSNSIGIMARRRKGQLSNWNPTLKQGLYLLADQFNRRPGSYWGEKLRENKKVLREKHPGVIYTDKNKMRYNDGHLHKMALWKTLRQFTRVMFREWSLLEKYPDHVAVLKMFKDMSPTEREDRLKKYAELETKKGASALA